MDLSSAFFWLFLNFLTIIILAFYSMMEMACVSFNKVRLQYYVSKGVKRAIWLNYLLQHPSRLFGTTLIGVNIALVIGSECSRQFYSSLGLSPEFSPLTQVILVVILGELAPMFAARLYAEHVAMQGMPLIYFSAKLMTPLIWCVGGISKVCNLLIGGDEPEENLYLNEEELQKIIEEHGDEPMSETDEFSTIATNIFNIRDKEVRQIMEPINSATALSSNATIAQMEVSLAKTGANFIPIYNRDITNIVGIVYPRDVLRAADTRRVRDYARPPWFVSNNSKIIQILKQFRTNNESVAVILNQEGKAVGLITLTDVLEEIFGESTYPTTELRSKRQKVMLIDKTFSGDTSVGDFYAHYGILLDQDPTMSLAQLIENHLGHAPEKEDSVYIAPFELTVKEMSLVDIKTISISTRM